MWDGRYGDSVQTLRPAWSSTISTPAALFSFHVINVFDPYRVDTRFIVPTAFSPSFRRAAMMIASQVTSKNLFVHGPVFKNVTLEKSWDRRQVDRVDGVSMLYNKMLIYGTLESQAT